MNHRSFTIGTVAIRLIAIVAVFSIVFGKMAKISSDGLPYPIFSYAALVPWTYFSTAMIGSTTSLIGNNMLSKIYFPRLVIPAIPVLAYLVDFVIAFSLLGVLMVYFNIFPTYNIIFLPLLILLMIFTASGIGMWLSSLAIQYRDAKFATTFFVLIEKRNGILDKKLIAILEKNI